MTEETIKLVFNLILDEPKRLQEKINYLREQKAITSNASTKFDLEKQIELLEEEKKEVSNSLPDRQTTFLTLYTIASDKVMGIMLDKICYLYKEYYDNPTFYTKQYIKSAFEEAADYIAKTRS